MPHVAEYAPSKHWPNWLRKEEREHAGFARSQQKRKLVEQVFGWIKASAGMRRSKLRGKRRVDWMFRLAATAYNLVRMRRLLANSSVSTRNQPRSGNTAPSQGRQIGHGRTLKITSEIESNEKSIVFQQPVKSCPDTKIGRKRLFQHPVKSCPDAKLKAPAPSGVTPLILPVFADYSPVQAAYN